MMYHEELRSEVEGAPLHTEGQKKLEGLEGGLVSAWDFVVVVFFSFFFSFFFVVVLVLLCCVPVSQKT